MESQSPARSTVATFSRASHARNMHRLTLWQSHTKESLGLSRRPCRASKRSLPSTASTTGHIRKTKFERRSNLCSFLCKGRGPLNTTIRGRFKIRCTTRTAKAESSCGGQTQMVLGASCADLRRLQIGRCSSSVEWRSMPNTSSCGSCISACRPSFRQ